MVSVDLFVAYKSIRVNGRSLEGLSLVTV